MKTLYLIPLLLMLQLNACALLNKQNKPVQAATENPQLPVQSAQPANQDLLEYTARFTDLSVELQKKELSQVTQALSQNKSDINLRSKAAVIYSIPGSKLKDFAKAQTLLDELLNEKSLLTNQKNLLSLLRDFIVDSNKLALKIKDEQKRSDTAFQKLDAAQQRADALQQKLDELKDIEKTMIDRDLRKPQ